MACLVAVQVPFLEVSCSYILLPFAKYWQLFILFPLKDPSPVWSWLDDLVDFVHSIVPESVSCVVPDLVM